MKNRKIYIIIFIVSLGVFLGTESKMADFVFGMEIVSAAFLVFQVWYMKKRFHVRLELSENVIIRGEKICANISGKNKGKLPIAHMEAEVFYKDACSGQWKKETVEGIAETAGEIKIQILWKTSYCGVVKVKLNKVRIYDYLGAFSGKCEVDSKEKEIYVLPLNNVFESETREELGEYTGSYGEELDETYEIREFRNGDDVRQIHWKLTAKMDMLLMREYLKSAGNDIFIYLDITKEDYERAVRAEIDAFLDKAASLSFEMMQCSIPHFVAWQFEKEGIYLCSYITEEESFTSYEMLLVDTTVCGNVTESICSKEPVGDEENLYIIRMDFQGRFYQGKME